MFFNPGLKLIRKSVTNHVFFRITYFRESRVFFSKSRIFENHEFLKNQKLECLRISVSLLENDVITLGSYENDVIMWNNTKFITAYNFISLLWINKFFIYKWWFF